MRKAWDSTATLRAVEEGAEELERDERVLFRGGGGGVEAVMAEAGVRVQGDAPAVLAGARKELLVEEGAEISRGRAVWWSAWPQPRLPPGGSRRMLWCVWNVVCSRLRWPAGTEGPGCAQQVESRLEEGVAGERGAWRLQGWGLPQGPEVVDPVVRQQEGGMAGCCVDAA